MTRPVRADEEADPKAMNNKQTAPRNGLFRSGRRFVLAVVTKARKDPPKTVIVVAMAIILLMCLYVPYRYKVTGRFGFSGAGYQWLWGFDGHDRLAVGRLAVQIFAVAVVSGTVLWLMKTPSRREHDEKGNQP